MATAEGSPSSSQAPPLTASCSMERDNFQATSSGLQMMQNFMKDAMGGMAGIGEGIEEILRPMDAVYYGYLGGQDSRAQSQEVSSPSVYEKERSKMTMDVDDYDQLDLGDLDVRFWRPTLPSEIRLSVRQVALRDKLAFVLGVVLLWWAGYSLGAAPQRFYQTYTRQLLALMLIRLVEFRMKKMHYYLFDFCYFANAAMLVYVWFLASSPLLSRLLFAYCNGPLAWSIIMFRNSLVLHSPAHLTSLFIHIYPPVVMWTVRWRTDVARFGKQEGASVAQLVGYPLLMYGMWVVLYYVKIFVLSGKKI